jgi:hypothetical protein
VASKREQFATMARGSGRSGSRSIISLAAAIGAVLLFPPAAAFAQSCAADKSAEDSSQAQLAVAEKHAASGSAAALAALLQYSDLDVVFSFRKTDWMNKYANNPPRNWASEALAGLGELWDLHSAEMAAFRQYSEAFADAQRSWVVVAIWKNALSTAHQDYVRCTHPPERAAVKPICDVKRPLLKSGDNVAATMTVTSNYLCTCGFQRSDGWLKLTTPPSNGTATASNNGCTYQSRDGFKGADSFQLMRGWPEGGSATVTFTVTVVDGGS